VISVLGAAVLAVSVFLPWYGISVTASGAASVPQELATVAADYGNTKLQTEANKLAPKLRSLAGKQLATVSSHDALKRLSPVLLFLAALTLLASLFLLAGVVGLIDSTGRQLALAGAVAGGVVVFRVVAPPVPDANLVALTPVWGSWLALLGSGAIVGGGLLAGWRPTSRRARLGYIQHT
jgi:hypothetical protein